MSRALVFLKTVINRTLISYGASKNIRKMDKLVWRVTFHNTHLESVEVAVTGPARKLLLAAFEECEERQKYVFKLFKSFKA